MKQIIISLLKNYGYEVFEDPPNSDCWWVVIGPGDRSINVMSLELTPDLKWVQIKKKYFGSGDN